MQGVKKLVKNLFHRIGVDVIRYDGDALNRVVVSLEPKDRPRGHVLLSYVVEPLLREDGHNVLKKHTHYWESLMMARIFLDMGYAVDIIDYHNDTFTPQKDYSLFVGTRNNFERMAKQIAGNCLKIVHLDTAHWISNNHAAHGRLMNLLQRRGIAIRGSLRLIENNSGIEYADYATILGNEFTIGTYSYAQKPLFRIPVSTCAVYEWDDQKNFDACSRNYLWFGSAGAVHRGLDILLEIFSSMTDYNLYICGPIEAEKHFVRAYFKELYQTPNIHFMGWVDVTSSRFAQITSNCCCIVYPSCGEGQCGAVVNCLHAGLIPIISYETGVDVNDFGVILKDCSLDTIRQTLKNISGLPSEKLREMSRKAWEYARKNHTRERFAEEYKKAITQIMTDAGRSVSKSNWITVKSETETVK
jgi:glycosyltransferase involved in cell wall biosynthesis